MCHVCFVNDPVDTDAGRGRAVSRLGTDDNWMTDGGKGMAGKRLKYRDLIQ